MDQLDDHMEKFMKEFSGIMDAITQSEFETLVSCQVTAQHVQCFRNHVLCPVSGLAKHLSSIL